MSILIFCFILFLLFYGYLIYPVTLSFFARSADPKMESEGFKAIHLLIAAYNEERHIEHTIRKICAANTDIPLQIYIGNDGSTDGTSAILNKLQAEYPSIRIEKFARCGKAHVINSIIHKYRLALQGNALIFMDANIELEPQTLSKIVHHLQGENVGMVGSAVYPMNAGMNVESKYILRENRIKSDESKAFGISVGVFGACFGMRGELYIPVPKNFITDDLYLTLSVIRQGYRIYYSEEIRVMEEITADVMNEFDRKKRYAAGNFQILAHFKDLLNPLRTNLGHVYAYFFHKVVRWVAPVLIFGFWVISFFANESRLFYIIRLSGIGIWLFLYVNYTLYRMDKSAIAGRIYYFLVMNLAILIGFFKWIKGIKTNVWERSERY